MAKHVFSSVCGLRPKDAAVTFVVNDHHQGEYRGHHHHNKSAAIGQRSSTGPARKKGGEAKRVDDSNHVRHSTIKPRFIPEQMDGSGERGGGRGGGGGGGGGGGVTANSGTLNRGGEEREVAAKKHTTTTTSNGHPTKNNGNHLVRDSNAPPPPPPPLSEIPRSPSSLRKPRTGVSRRQTRENDEQHGTGSTTGGSGTTRPRTFVDRQQRPKSAVAVAAAAAVLLSSTSTIPNQRRKHSDRERRQKFLPSSETTTAKPGGEPPEQQSGVASAGKTRCSSVGQQRVIPTCWSVDKMAGRRPPPLGRTNAPSITAAKQRGLAENELGRGVGSRYRLWNGSCSCDDLSLGLIDKDMERARREFHHQTGGGELAAATEAHSPRTTARRRRRSGDRKRSSSRPITGTSARFAFTAEGDGTRGSPLYERHHRRNSSSTPAALLAAKVARQYGTNSQKSATATTNRNAGIKTVDSQARAQGVRGEGEGGRRKEWNDSTRVDDIPPDALLCKHPGWGVAAPGRGGREEIGAVSVRHRRGFFYGGSTERTITTRGSSSAPTRDT